jgi:hypothetical protein
MWDILAPTQYSFGDFLNDGETWRSQFQGGSFRLFQLFVNKNKIVSLASRTWIVVQNMS